MNEIQKLRARTGLSQSKFAKKFEININTLQAWEINNSKPNKCIIHMITRILDLEEKYEQKEGQQTK